MKQLPTIFICLFDCGKRYISKFFTTYTKAVSFMGAKKLEIHLAPMVATTPVRWEESIKLSVQAVASQSNDSYRRRYRTTMNKLAFPVNFSESQFNSSSILTILIFLCPHSES